MRSEKVPPSVWLRNFKKSLGELIELNKKNGYIVKRVVMTVGIYDKLAEALQYEPTDILGYVIEIREQTEEQYQLEGDDIGIVGSAIN